MNEYTKGALDTLQIVREAIVEIADTAIDLPTALVMIESGVRFGGELRDAMDAALPVVNANLIAAAPDLLTACEMFVEAVESNDSQDLRVAADVARDAVEKAKGEQ